MINFGFQWSGRNSLAFPENSLNLDNQKFAEKKKRKKERKKNTIFKSSEHFLEKIATFFKQRVSIILYYFSS